jgi:hypothetical protein
MKGHKERSLQTEIVQKISDKQKSFSGCSKRHNIYDRLNTTRLRIVLNLRINEEGKIDRFASNTPNLPEDFMDCLFKIVDGIKFPPLAKNEAVDLEQPLIFIKR